MIFFYIITFSQQKKDTINCNLNASNGSICPICKTNKKVLPIFYGLVTTKFIKANKKKYHFGGCEISHFSPIWYCKTDRLEF